MNSRILLKSQKNEILDLIREKRLDPADFEWEQCPSEKSPGRVISRLTYVHGNFFYAFEMKGDVHHAVFSPARQSYIGSDYPVTWSRQKECVSAWLDNLVKEENEPDMWETVKRVKEEGDGSGRGTYVVMEPSDKSPDVSRMISRVHEILQKKPEDPAKRPHSPIKRYYGKA